ncbi:MAG: alanine racemase [Coriobacteriales bacterium]|jgi:alanine racemase
MPEKFGSHTISGGSSGGRARGFGDFSDLDLDGDRENDLDQDGNGENRFEEEERFDFSVDPTDYRWAWVEVDKDAIVHNVREINKKIGPRPRLLATVKADAYGHGAVEVSKIALSAGADWLSVATVQEGAELREAGITCPILLLSQPPARSIPALLHYNIIPSVYSTDFALALGEMAAARGLVADFHLGINTGMNRIGVWYDDVVEFLRLISFHKGINLAGTFTHFATADEFDDYAFMLQLRRFKEAVNAIRAAGFDPGIVHCANSAAAIRYKDSCFDMVRAGIAIYGLHPSSATHGVIELWPAMSVKARITAVNEVPVGEGVGYGLTYRSPGHVKICTVPLGYADGLSRALSNRMKVLYDGKYCQQVGNICMDQFMFEVDRRSTLLNPASDPEFGDEVVIIGRQGDKILHLDEMAGMLGTINYELACRFGMRLPKVYV